MKNIDINKVSVYEEHKGTKVKYIKRCEVCKSAKIDLISNKLICKARDFDFVENFQCCSAFKLDEKIKNEMINKCIKVFK